MTQPILIDFAPSRPFWRSLWTMAFVVVWVLALGFGVHDLRLHMQEQVELAQQLERLQAGRRANKAERADALPTDVVQAANQVIGMIDRPWGALLAALERANVEAATLLAVEPDMERRDIRISGEAKDGMAMLEHVRALARQSELHNVYLANHQVNVQDAQRPVRYTVQASWKEATTVVIPVGQSGQASNSSTGDSRP